MYLKEKLRLVLIVLATMFLAGGSFFVMDFVNKTSRERKEKDLYKTLELIQDGINDKLISAEGLIYSLRGLVVDNGLNSQKWQDFITNSDVNTRYPGVYSLAYVERVQKNKLSEFEENLRKTESENYKKYAVFPKTNSSEYFPVKYLYASDPELNSMLGFDFRYSEKSINTFVDSVTTGKPALSEPLHLSVVMPESKKVGYILVLPVYDRTSVMELPNEERKKFLMGFVGAWISSDDLRNKEVDLKGLRYSLFDGGEKLFSVGSISRSVTSITRNVRLSSREFKLTLESDNSYMLPGIQGNMPVVVLIGLVTINLLWIVTVYSIMSSRRRAIDFASMTTKDLRRFKQAVDSVSDHVVFTNPDGVIIYANKAATDITGYSLEEMLGNKPSLWGGQMTKEYYSAFWKTIKIDKKPYWGELTNRRKSGELYESELRASPILDEKGNLLFFVGIERDLSKFRAVDKMKTEFISLASHQLRTPLSAVKWFSEMLIDGEAGKLTEDQKKYVEKINESNEREIQLVNALLNVSRIDEGKIVVVPKVVDIGKMVGDLLTETKVSLVGTKKKFEYNVEKELPEVEIDVDLIKHVYSNLLTNAIKYSKPDGKIRVNIFRQGDEIVSEIVDDGIGIPKAEQKRVFEKFFRGSNALKKETDGSGLGLYLVKTIIESSKGKIWFTSDEGKGSLFSFSIPIKAPKV